MTLGRSKTPSQVLLERFAYEALLTSAPSASGHQIEALRDETQPNRDGWRGDAMASRRQQYADLVLLTKDLNPEEFRVCRLRYGCTAGITTYRRLVTKWNLQDAMQHQCEIPLKEVPENPDLIVVEGTHVLLPDYEAIARVMSASSQATYTPRQVKRLLEGARAKVAVAIKWRRFQEDIEDRYE